MKRIFLLLFIPMFSMAQPTGITFVQSTLAVAKTEAKAKNKMLFVDAYADWCSPCKWMADNVFTDTTVAKFYNQNFLCIKLDAEKGEGIEFAKAFGIIGFPTFIFLNANGELIHKTVGQAEVKDFLQYGKDAVSPTENLIALQNRYKNGERNSDFLYTFSKASLLAYDLKFIQYSNEYFKSLPADFLITENTWNAVKLFMPDINSFMFNYVLKNKAKYAQFFGEQNISEYIDEAELQSLQQAVHSKDSLMLEKSKKLIIETGSFDAQKLMAMSELKYYRKNKNSTKFLNLAKVYAEKYFMTDALSLNEVTSDFYRLTDSKENLALAEKWAKHCCDLEDDYYNNDLYANILSKEGKTEDAIKAAQKAIDIGIKNGDDTSSTDALLKSLKGR